MLIPRDPLDKGEHVCTSIRTEMKGSVIQVRAEFAIPAAILDHTDCVGVCVCLVTNKRPVQVQEVYTRNLLFGCDPEIWAVELFVLFFPPSRSKRREKGSRLSCDGEKSRKARAREVSFEVPDSLAVDRLLSLLTGLPRHPYVHVMGTSPEGKMLRLARSKIASGRRKKRRIEWKSILGTAAPSDRQTMSDGR